MHPPIGVSKQKFHVFKAKMTLNCTLLSSFSQNFPGGHAPSLLSMTRGLKTNVLSFYGKKWLKKITILGSVFKNFLGCMSPEPLYDSEFTNKSV